MIIRIISGILLLFSAFMSAKHGWAGLSFIASAPNISGGKSIKYSTVLIFNHPLADAGRSQTCVIKQLQHQHLKF